MRRGAARNRQRLVIIIAIPITICAMGITTIVVVFFIVVGARYICVNATVTMTISIRANGKSIIPIITIPLLLLVVVALLLLLRLLNTHFFPPFQFDNLCATDTTPLHEPLGQPERYHPPSHVRLQLLNTRGIHVIVMIVRDTTDVDHTGGRLLHSLLAFWESSRARKTSGIVCLVLLRVEMRQ